jgi:hypothetical protein
MTRKTNPSPRWRDVLKVHPAAELFPLMSPNELRELADDIKQHGLRQPVSFVRDDDGRAVLIDGRNRLNALELLGDEQRLHLNNSVVFEEVVADIDIYAHVVSLNIHRRHLTAEQKRDLVAKLLKAAPEKSDRQIADQTKSNRTTVGQIRKKLEKSGDVSIVDTRTDTKGRKQQAAKSRRKPVKPSRHLAVITGQPEPVEIVAPENAASPQITDDPPTTVLAPPLSPEAPPKHNAVEIDSCPAPVVSRKQAICQQVCGAIRSLYGLPAPDQVAGYFENDDLSIDVDEFLQSAHKWLNEFAAVWEKKRLEPSADGGFPVALLRRNAGGVS